MTSLDSLDAIDPLVIPRTELCEWTKRLGQQHWARDGESRTLCGKPMLGNNYAQVYHQVDKTPCPDCLRVLHGE